MQLYVLKKNYGVHKTVVEAKFYMRWEVVYCKTINISSYFVLIQFWIRCAHALATSSVVLCVELNEANRTPASE